jgi:arylsulfatase A-like enzyme
VPVRHRKTNTASIVVAIITVALVGGLIVGANLLGARTHGSSTDRAVITTTTGESTERAPVTFASERIRNVVLVLADDLDWKLWKEIPRLSALETRGMTFTNYTVSDSLCCPSRTTIFRGQYVHNHQVISNEAVSGGGWPTFRDKGYPNDCLPTWLQSAGVHTGLIGKYLNEFPQTPAEETTVPPGWDEFVVPTTPVGAYKGYNYRLSTNGVITTYGQAPRDYLNDVLNSKADAFLASAPQPFFLELASFTPHLPSPVAPRHRGSHAGARVPRDGAFNAPVSNPPSWLKGLVPLGVDSIKHLDRTWQRRAESAEAFADSVDTVLSALTRSGHDQDTLVIVTSDNGFHMGSYRTHRGKRTAFDVDTVVPLVAIGPGVRPGAVQPQMTSETDIGPTIASLLGAATPDWVDGRSLAGLVDPTSQAFGAQSSSRTAALSESLGKPGPEDPDYELLAPPTFTALRTREWLYVRAETGEEELYNRVSDPFEIDNIISTAPRQVVDALRAQFIAMKTCAGPTCRVADSMPVPLGRSGPS